MNIKCNIEPEKYSIKTGDILINDERNIIVMVSEYKDSTSTFRAIVLAEGDGHRSTQYFRGEIIHWNKHDFTRYIGTIALDCTE